MGYLEPIRKRQSFLFLTTSFQNLNVVSTQIALSYKMTQNQNFAVPCLSSGFVFIASAYRNEELIANILNTLIHYGYFFFKIF